MRTDYSSYIKICICVLALGLSGCGDDNDDDQVAGQTAQIETQAAATETTADTTDKTALPTLQNTTWVLRSINGRTVIDNVAVTMAMDNEGRIGGRSGCNNYGAGYALDGGQIKITEQMAATMMACVPPAIAEQEAQYLDILHNVTSWKMVEPNGLVLTTPDNRVLAFTPEMAATSQK